MYNNKLVKQKFNFKWSCCKVWWVDDCQVRRQTFGTQTRPPKSQASLVIWWHPLGKNLKSQKLENAAYFQHFFIRQLFFQVFFQVFISFKNIWVITRENKALSSLGYNIQAESLGCCKPIGPGNSPIKKKLFKHNHENDACRVAYS